MTQPIKAGQRGRPIRSMDEFYERFLPKEWAKIKFERRVEEVGFGQAWAEELMSRTRKG